MRLIRKLARSTLRRLGLSVTRFSNTLGFHRHRILCGREISVVLDVGANAGQYAHELRAAGFRGRIVSFEPVPQIFDELARWAVRTHNQSAMNLALGNFDGLAEIYVSENLASTSLLKILDRHASAAPMLQVKTKKEVRVARLDSIRQEILAPGDRAYVKIDTQGYEKEVLLGAVETLPRVQAVELEMSLVPLYERQPLLPEVWEWLTGRGFNIVWIEPGYRDPVTGDLLQLDALFARTNAGPIIGPSRVS